MTDHGILFQLSDGKEIRVTAVSLLELVRYLTDAPGGSPEWDKDNPWQAAQEFLTVIEKYPNSEVAPKARTQRHKAGRGPRRGSRYRQADRRTGAD